MNAHSSGAGGNAELREFLRSRRARITPAEAGLSPQSGARRVPGLRREEVAQLAGVSVDYYIRLERGRDVNVSDSVLDALARALRLNDTERGHLYAVARPVRAPRRPIPPQRVRPGVHRVLEALHETPAMVIGRRLDVLAGNRMAYALFPDFGALPPRKRNYARYLFLGEGARELYADWEAAARATVASLHLYAGRFPHDPLLTELTDELARRDADFQRWWEEHDVLRRTYGSKSLRHPIVGDLTLEYEALTVTDDPEQSLGLYTAEAGSPSERGLRLLAEWAADPSGGTVRTAPSRTDAASVDG
jgi:transcriptional regulator with XRE-family HTH domain